GGKAPGLASFRRDPAIRPSSAMLRRSSFRATRSLPFTPKARAISRLPDLPLAVSRKSRISCFEGSLPTVAWRGAPLVFATGSSACRLLDGFLVALAALARGLLCSRLAARSPSGLLTGALRASRGDQLDRLLDRRLVGLDILRQRGVDLAMLHV